MVDSVSYAQKVIARRNVAKIAIGRTPVQYNEQILHEAAKEQSTRTILHASHRLTELLKFHGDINGSLLHIAKCMQPAKQSNVCIF